MDSSQIAFALPSGVAAPKFQLFQEVFYGDRVCIVTGLSYVSFEEALITNASSCGWQYTVSYVFGKSQDEILSARRTDDLVWENGIELVMTSAAVVSLLN